ncbi:hypothetical protein WA026_016191 [Henosepilachna vigintioctopunctata]|uniref:Ig-like domain-containing protein n=1 Tax=Henosepilachna vigintioctopunctata TaxID=420089 RepID=A0AAW1TUY4_9CUCU
MLLYIISLITLLKVKSEEDISNKSVENCRERNRLISTEKGDLYALVDAALGEKLILQCHYCREQDDSKSKIWYIVDVFGLSEPEEVKIDMENEDSKNRIQISSDHSLTVSNLTYNDTGVYFCMRFEQLDNEEKISYLVDRKFM